MSLATRVVRVVLMYSVFGLRAWIVRRYRNGRLMYLDEEQKVKTWGRKEGNASRTEVQRELEALE